MSEKQEIIQKMIAMQKTFIEYENKNGVTQEEYFQPESGHTLDGYRQAYQELASRLGDLAHEEKGSKS
ncbi:MAG: hypothetical protein ACI8P9_002862 [Parasphingorhabdus sp.]|jgi:hypothetical protein